MVDDILPDTWSWREMPVLREATRLSDARYGGFVTTDEVAAATGLERADVWRAGRALASAGLIETIGDGEQIVSDFREPSAHARRLTGAWPTSETAADRLLAALEALAANATDEPTRTRARLALTQVGGFSRDTLAAIAATVITGQIPGTSS